MSSFVKKNYGSSMGEGVTSNFRYKIPQLRITYIITIVFKNTREKRDHLWWRKRKIVYGGVEVAILWRR